MPRGMSTSDLRCGIIAGIKLNHGAVRIASAILRRLTMESTNTMAFFID